MKPADSFWGEITSSVDFCEAFRFSPYCAEPANAVSSLVLTILGLAGLLGAKRNEVHINAGSRWHDCAFAAMYGTRYHRPGVRRTAYHVILVGAGTRRGACCSWPCSRDAVSSPRRGRLRGRGCQPTCRLRRDRVSLHNIPRLLHGISHLLHILRGGDSAPHGFLALRPKEARGIRVAFIRPFFLGGVLSYICCGSFAWFTDFLLCDAISQRLGLSGDGRSPPSLARGSWGGHFLGNSGARGAVRRRSGLLRAGVARWRASIRHVQAMRGKKGGPQSLGQLACAPGAPLRPLRLWQELARGGSRPPPKRPVCNARWCRKTTSHRFESYQERADDRRGPRPHRLGRPSPRHGGCTPEKWEQWKQPKRGEMWEPPRFCCVEGHVLATDEVLAAAASFAVVFEGDEATCRSRRLGRRPRPDEERRVLENYIVEFVWPAFLRYGRPAQDSLEEQLLLRSPGGRGRRCCLRIAGEDARTPEELAKDVLQALGNSGLV